MLRLQIFSVLQAKYTTKCMISTQIFMLLRIYSNLLNNSNILFLFLNMLRSGPLCLLLIVKLKLISGKFYLSNTPGMNAKLFGNMLNCMIGNKLIMHKPIEVIRSNLDVVHHNLPEPLVICNHK